MQALWQLQPDGILKEQCLMAEGTLLCSAEGETHLKDIAGLSSTDIDGPSQQVDTISVACSTHHSLSGLQVALRGSMYPAAAAAHGDAAAE